MGLVSEGWVRWECLSDEKSQERSLNGCPLAPKCSSLSRLSAGNQTYMNVHPASLVQWPRGSNFGTHVTHVKNGHNIWTILVSAFASLSDSRFLDHGAFGLARFDELMNLMNMFLPASNQ